MINETRKEHLVEYQFELATTRYAFLVSGQLKTLVADHPSLTWQVPNAAPKDKKDEKGKDNDKDKDSDKASLKSSKSEGKRKTTVSEIEIHASPMSENEKVTDHGDHVHIHGDAGEGGESQHKSWRASQLGRDTRGMETEEDMIKQRDEIKGLIEKKTYIGLVSQL